MSNRVSRRKVNLRPGVKATVLPETTYGKVREKTHTTRMGNVAPVSMPDVVIETADMLETQEHYGSRMRRQAAYGVEKVHHLTGTPLVKPMADDEMARFYRAQSERMPWTREE